MNKYLESFSLDSHNLYRRGKVIRNIEPRGLGQEEASLGVGQVPVEEEEELKNFSLQIVSAVSLAFQSTNGTSLWLGNQQSPLLPLSLISGNLWESQPNQSIEANNQSVNSQFSAWFRVRHLVSGSR